MRFTEFEEYLVDWQLVAQGFTGSKMFLFAILVHLLKLLRVQMDVIGQIGIDLEVVRALNRIDMETIQDVDAVGTLIYGWLFDRQFLDVVIIWRLFEPHFLKEFQVCVNLSVNFNFDLAFEHEKFLFVIRHKILDIFDNGVVVSEAERQPFLG